MTPTSRLIKVGVIGRVPWEGGRMNGREYL
jgi:hypothetical protein